MYLEKVYIKKKNGALQDYTVEKIIVAIRKSAERCTSPLTENEESEVIALVESRLVQLSDNIVPVEQMHAFVESALAEVRKDVADAYFGYRSLSKKWAGIMDDIKRKVSSLLFIGDKDNANVDSKLASTITCLSAGYLGASIYEEQFLTRKEKQATEDGYIYIHDKDKRYFYPYNCCLFDIKSLLKGGFEMSNMWYNEPKSLDVVFDVIGDITLMAASQQYGGFTIPEVDDILEEYAEKAYLKYCSDFIQMGVEAEKAKEEAINKVTYDMYQGFQGWEYKFNTVASSRGDYPFITVTFGLNTSRWGKLASKAIVDVRRKGQGKKGYKRPVLFPKLVFLYDENLHGEGKELEDIFEAGVECSRKTMYPDWLSLTGKGYIASMYKQYGKVISPMGCRAFLSPWYEKGGIEPQNKEDKPVFVGRFNVGAVSLNLPMIFKKAEMEDKDFYEVLDYYLEMIRGLHKRTYRYIGQMPASRAPLAFCEGGLYGGNLGYNDKIEPCLKSATSSFGVTALNELQVLYNGKNLVNDGIFALEVMDYINAKVSEFKKVDGHLYAVYGTPAEKLCGRQVEQFRKEYGIILGVSDREYVSNSFHCHVTASITPIEKQNLEYRFWEKCNGGKIQYVKYPIDYNVKAIKTLLRRAMAMGLYEGVNLSLSYCDDCGYQAVDIGDACPKCGSKNLTKIDRMNGYLAFSRVKGESRLNAAKVSEISERCSM